MVLRASTWLAEGAPPSKRLKKTIRRVLNNNIESKFLNINISYSQPTTGNNFTLNPCGPGTNRDNRVGIRVRGLRQQVKLVCTDTGAVRVILYCPKNPDNVIPTGSVFGSVDQADFWILHDHIYGPPQRTGSGNSFAINISKKLGFFTHWGGSTSTDFQKNPVKMHIVTEKRNGTQGQIQGHTKYWFKDL